MNKLISLAERREDPELFDEIIENLRGKKFFAVSVDENNQWRRHTYQINEEKVIYGCELLRLDLLKEAAE
jgi:hypothetical protein